MKRILNIYQELNTDLVNSIEEAFEDVRFDYAIDLDDNCIIIKGQPSGDDVYFAIKQLNKIGLQVK